MISVVIIEDDFISSDLLISYLNEMDEIEIKAVLRSVKDGIDFLRIHPEADLILSDIQ